MTAADFEAFDVDVCKGRAHFVDVYSPSKDLMGLRRPAYGMLVPLASVLEPCTDPRVCLAASSASRGLEVPGIGVVCMVRLKSAERVPISVASSGRLNDELDLDWLMRELWLRDACNQPRDSVLRDNDIVCRVQPKAYDVEVPGARWPSDRRRAGAPRHHSEEALVPGEVRHALDGVLEDLLEELQRQAEENFCPLLRSASRPDCVAYEGELDLRLLAEAAVRSVRERKPAWDGGRRR